MTTTQVGPCIPNFHVLESQSLCNLSIWSLTCHDAYTDTACRVLGRRSGRDLVCHLCSHTPVTPSYRNMTLRPVLGPKLQSLNPQNTCKTEEPMWSPALRKAVRPWSDGTVCGGEPICIPEGPCTQTVETLAPKYPYRLYVKAKVCTVWVHGALGLRFMRFRGLGFRVRGSCQSVFLVGLRVYKGSGSLQRFYIQ